MALVSLVGSAVPHILSICHDTILPVAAVLSMHACTVYNS